MKKALTVLFAAVVVVVIIAGAMPASRTRKLARSITVELVFPGVQRLLNQVEAERHREANQRLNDWMAGRASQPH